jgi:3-oxoacyl-[acyl-carrier protein] reductase
MTVYADIGDATSVMQMRDTVVATLGHPSIIVNNAVVQYQWTSVLEQAVEDYESQFRSCVLQNVLMAKAFAPDMIAQRWGRIIAINTECAMQNFPNQSAYVSGKRGMDGVLRVLAKEIGEHQITVNQVAPGWMISDKYRGTPEEIQPEYSANVPLKRRGYDQDIANAVAFLASDLAAFITGAYIPVSGGNVMPAI